MPVWLWIGFGGFIGAILRYFVSGGVQSGWVTFPMGTLTVNFIGSFLLSLVLYLSQLKGIFTDEIRLFLTVGILGSFTTMSTFGYESMRLLEQKETLLFGANVVGSVALTLFAVYLGKVLSMNI